MLGTSVSGGHGSVGLVIGENGEPVEAVVFLRKGESLPVRVVEVE
jgi:hypothetical protein